MTFRIRVRRLATADLSEARLRMKLGVAVIAGATGGVQQSADRVIR